MTYVSVLDNKLVTIDPSAPKKKAASKSKVGCEHCPQNEREFIVKLKGFKRIEGKTVFIWGESPGFPETDAKKLFVNQASQWLFDQLRRVGIKRSDCDLQYVVRCWTTDATGSKLKGRTPNRDEIKCCSTYNQRAIELNGGKATVHIVLGEIAGKSLLGREYKKGTPIFWSERLNAHVVCVDPPINFLRNAPKHKLITFQQRLEAAAKFISHPGKYSFIESLDYKLVTTLERVKKVVRIAKKKAARGNRISIDIETGWLDEHGRATKTPGIGKEVVLCVGITWAPGQSRCIVLDHPEHKWRRNERRRVITVLKSLIEDPRVSKVMHHGSSDARGLRGLIGIRVKGYRFDTNYSTYLRWPHQKAYGLDALSQSRFTDFCNYKDIIKPYLPTNKKGKVDGTANYANIPLNILRLYNGADADLTKRCELVTDKVNLSLLTAYTDAAFTLDAMEHRGPWFDTKHYDNVVHLIPKRLKIVKKRLMKLSGSKKTKLGSNVVIASILYDKFDLPVPTDKTGKPKRTTDKETLKLFALGKGRSALFCKLLIEYRMLSKMETTYIGNYMRSAEVNGGQLRTRWWLTGASSGRMSSGGGKSKEVDRVNFQNLHGDPVLQNLLISDKRWRIVIKGGWEERWDEIEEMQSFLALDYGQVEIRMLAEFSQDPLLIRAIESGDIHSSVGHELTGISIDKIKNDKNIRTMIKQVHFGIIYGLTVKGLWMKLNSEGVKVTKAYCQELYDKYFQRFKRVREWIDSTRRIAERNGFVETLFGFRRPIFTEGEDGRDSYWGNQAVNSPIQGSAHQLLLFALATLRGVSERYSHLDKCVMEVHDALVFFTTVGRLPVAFKQAKHLMEKGVPAYIEKHFGKRLKTPLLAEGKAGFRFGSLTDYDAKPPKEFIRKWRESNKWTDRQIELIWVDGKTKDEAKKIIGEEKLAMAV